MGLVHQLCNRFRGRGIEYDDLVQAGSIGLIKAVDGFDASLGLMFSTYAVPVILGEIKHLFRDGGSVKVSRSLKECSLKVTAFREKIAKTEGRDPTLGEVAKALGITEEEVASALDAARPVLSLSSAMTDEEGTIDVPVDEQEAVLNRLTIGEIRTALADEDWRLLGLRYFRGQTQTETAAALGMTQVQVSRRERAILTALRNRFAG